MENFFDSFEFTDIIVAVCIFLLGYLVGRVSGKASASKKAKTWDRK